MLCARPWAAWAQPKQQRAVGSRAPSGGDEGRDSSKPSPQPRHWHQDGAVVETSGGKGPQRLQRKASGKGNYFRPCTPSPLLQTSS